LLLAGCISSPTKPATPAPSLPANDTPAHAVSRLIDAYETKSQDAYAGMFTGDFTYEFSNTTDPTLVTQYSTGWFRTDETASSSHLFHGYTPQGGETLAAATAITINLATTTPSDDNTSGDPERHKVLRTRVDGIIAVPQAGGEPLNYIITNNDNVFYFVRGDAADSLSSSQPADTLHWYVYKWLDLTGSSAQGGAGRMLTEQATWGKLKASYR
jgi:hypothetical protein